MGRPPASSTNDELRGLLRERGLRATAPRVAVLRRLQEASAPISHGDLATELAPDGWDRATIYRNLIDLTDAGLARRTDVGDHVWRFELRGEPDEPSHKADHAHFMCEACGDVMCLPEQSVQIKVPRSAPRALRRQRVEIQLKGRCDNCE